MGFLAAGLEKAKMTTVHLEERGDLVIEVGTYSMDIAPPGGDRFTDDGKYVVVYRRSQDGELKMWIDIVNSNAAPEA